MKTAIAILLLGAAYTASAGIAFFQYEYTTGMTKQCVYDYLGSKYTLTLSSVSLCPLTLEV